MIRCTIKCEPSNTRGATTMSIHPGRSISTTAEGPVDIHGAGVDIKAYGGWAHLLRPGNGFRRPSRYWQALKWSAQARHGFATSVMRRWLSIKAIRRTYCRPRRHRAPRRDWRCEYPSIARLLVRRYVAGDANPDRMLSGSSRRWRSRSADSPTAC